MNNSPGPVTRSQMQLTMVKVGGTNQLTTSSRAVTISQTGEGLSNTMTTLRKSTRKRLGLTPKKGEEHGCLNNLTTSCDFCLFRFPASFCVCEFVVLNWLDDSSLCINLCEPG